VGVADLADGTGAPVHMPEGERMLLERPGELAPMGNGYPPHTPEVTLTGRESIDVAGIAFDVLSVPGHSPAHVAYYADGCLFSGDVLFAGSVGRTDIPGADWDTLMASIRMLVDTLPAETVVYPGHGPITTLGAELAGNPFLSELRAERTA
jgi:hydroxyacylglutathione hydrolase